MVFSKDKETVSRDLQDQVFTGAKAHKCMQQPDHERFQNPI